MKVKILRVTMPDGSKWDVPADVIARNRADALVPSNSEHEEWREERTAALCHNEILFDWARNNMNWDDVSDVAEKSAMATVEVDYQGGWVNGHMEVVEVEQ